MSGPMDSQWPGSSPASSIASAQSMAWTMYSDRCRGPARCSRDRWSRSLPRVALPARSDAYAVVEVNDAVSEPALIDKFELRADVVGQRALAASHHDWAQEQMTLVDQPRANCVTSELGTPDCDVGHRGLLEPPHGVSIELALDPRPRAGYRLKRPGVHDLLSCPPDPRTVRPETLFCLAGPRGRCVGLLAR